MTEEEKFDDIVKSKVEAAEFNFNPDSWDKAEAMIIAADKKRKRRRIAFIFFIGLVLGVSIMIPFISSNECTNKNNFNVEHTIVTQTKVVAGNQSDKSANRASNHIKDKGSDKSEVQKHIIKVEIEEKKKNNQNNALGLSSSIKFEKPEKETVANEKSLQNKSKDIITSYGKNNLSKVAEKKKQKNSDRLAKINGNNSIVEVNKLVSTNTTSEKKDESKFTESNKLEVNDTSSKKTDSTIKIISVANNLAKDTISKTKIDTIKSVVNTDNSKISKRFTLGIDAGTNYSLGWSNNSIKEAAGFNGILGISLTYFFNEKWSALLGLQYNSLAHLKYSTYTSTNIKYDFGYAQTKTIVTPTILRYIAIPVKIEYWLNEKNSLSFGVNTLFLLNTSSKVETDTQSDFGAATAAFSTKAGYRDGFSNWDLQPALAYRRKIYKAFSISAEVYYGLMDIKNNTTFGISKAEHNSGLKLTLSYNILHK